MKEIETNHTMRPMTLNYKNDYLVYLKNYLNNETEKEKKNYIADFLKILWFRLFTI